MESEGLFHRHQYAYRKGLVTCDASLDIVCGGLAALDRVRELTVVQIDFSAAFDLVSNYRILFKLRHVVVGATDLYVTAVILVGWCKTAVGAKAGECW